MKQIKNSIFNKKNLLYQLNRIEKSSIIELDFKLDILNNWIKYINSGNTDLTKETSLQGKFLDDIFAKVLGYKDRVKNTDLWNLNQEQTTLIDSKSADGSLGFFTKENEDVRVVIELKGSKVNLDEKQHRHNDIRTPIEQAFSYQHKIGGKCKWVIVSNYKEIRLYHHSSSTEYEVFFLTELGDWEKFRKFYFLLSAENLISPNSDSYIDTFFTKNEIDEVNISKQFYQEFKATRNNLFEHLKANNPDKSELLLLEKTQKFLDRFIFLSFCEDNRLLPDKTFKRIINIGKQSFSFSDTKIWNELKGLFRAIDIGSPPHNINKFNGGLFAPDNELDSLVIKDSILEEISKLTEYDFETDIDVNILGHIFEQSISDIEEIKSVIEGKDFDKKTTKRKKDGIYYTPEYITKYIVENAIGGWLEDRKKELGYYELPEIKSEDFQSIKNVKGKIQLNDRLQKHLEFWHNYKLKLMSIKVLDPACGSGAFLNQAFNFLYAEGQIVNEKITELSGNQPELFGLDKHILSNNIFGVDLNNESVEITKLSLWIKTANAYAELTSLDQNIKCGNSLIDDPEVAGDKAFNWNIEFKEIMDDGGFDVVIGNPPYVRGRELEEIERRYLDKYEVPSNDTAALFIKKVIELLNINSKVSMIVPKSLLFASNWENIRNNISQLLEIIIDCGKVWEEVLLEQVIFLMSNTRKDYYTSGFRTGNSIIELDKIKNSTINFFDYIPARETNESLGLAMKIKINSESLNNFYNNIAGVPYQKYINDTGEFSMIGGADFDRITINSYKGKIDKKWVTSSNSFIVENSLIVQNIIAHIMNPKDHIKITACIPSDEHFYTTTIANTVNQLICKQDNEFLISNKYTWCLLNSNLLNWYVYHFVFSLAIRTMHFYNPISEKVPFINIAPESQQPFINLADIMLEKNKELQEIKKTYLEFIKGQFQIEKPTTKLQNWYELFFDDFCKELEKAKVKLSATQKYDLMPLFNREKTKAIEIKTLIDKTDKEIDQLVYKLYDLTEEEIAIVEGNN